MRTTLTLDPDVSELLREEAHRTRAPFKQVVNDAIRRGLARAGDRRRRRPYRVKPHATDLQPGIDRGRLNALADDLEVDAALAKLGRRARA